jgi:heme-degrading monooxygenase HmoA
MYSSTPPPPYYAVIFTSVLKEKHEGYEEAAQRMLELAKEQDGFLGIDSQRSDYGITISYWKDQDSIIKWREHSEHMQIQEKGKSEWYSGYTVRIAKVEKEYSF